MFEGQAKNALTIESYRVERQGNQGTLSAIVRVPGREFEIYFRGPEHSLSSRGGDPFLIVCLTTAMKLGLPLVMKSPVSPQLLCAADTVQDIYRKWDSDLKKIAIVATPRVEIADGKAEGVAVFFSGGVDSSFSVYRHLNEISALILVHGFDIRLHQLRLREGVSKSLQEWARSLDKPLLEVETNCREFTDPYVSWPNYQFGPALAAVGVFLGGVVNKVLIPSSESYAHLDPCGSHPLLDPLWSTEEVSIVHDGAEASRAEKLTLVANDPAALRFLRVCWKNPGDAYNCGHCEKCIRTMIGLELVGALGGCAAFKNKLDPVVVAEVELPSDLVFYHAEENLTLLKQQGSHAGLVGALETVIFRYRAKKAVRYLAELPASPGGTEGLLSAVWRHRRALLRELIKKFYGKCMKRNQ